jgi:serine/threonine protein kinase
MSATTWGPGQLIANRYRIEAPIGEGGFGQVFRATELKLDRPVAVKALRDEVLGRDDAEGRFHREAQLAKQLEHPNTVRLLDFGTAADGTPFIVYELLKGQSLDDYLRAQGALTEERVARITAQVLKSLMEAHDHGIVHRDIKPSNIFLCEFSGEKDFVKVLDFGIAKADAYKHAQLTRMGVAIGTPSYMAPEQVHGANIGPATDLYALGLVMAEMFTGRIIVSGATPALTAVEQASDKPVPLPPKVLQSPLGPVVLRATQKSIERRYGSAGDMLKELENLKLSGAQSTMPDGTRQSGDLGYARTSWVPNVSPNAHTHQGYAPLPQQQTPMSDPHASHVPLGAPTPAGSYGYPPAPGAQPPPPQMPPPQMYGPMPHSPMMAPPPRQGGSGAGWMIALLIGGGLITVVTLITLAIIVGISSSSSAGDGETDSDDSAEETESDKPDRPSNDTTIGKKDIEALETRLRDNGWEISGRNESNSEGFSLIVLQIQKNGGSGGGGAVQFYKYRDDRIADAVEDGFRKVENGAYARKGNNLMFVIATEINGTQINHVSQSLLDQLRGVL